MSAVSDAVMQEFRESVYDRLANPRISSQQSPEHSIGWRSTIFRNWRATVRNNSEPEQLPADLVRHWAVADVTAWRNLPADRRDVAAGSIAANLSASPSYAEALQSVDASLVEGVRLWTADHERKRAANVTLDTGDQEGTPLSLQDELRSAMHEAETFRDRGRIPDEEWTRLGLLVDRAYLESAPAELGAPLELSAIMASVDPSRPCPFPEGPVGRAFENERIYLDSRTWPNHDKVIGYLGFFAGANGDPAPRFVLERIDGLEQYALGLQELLKLLADGDAPRSADIKRLLAIAEQRAKALAKTEGHVAPSNAQPPAASQAGISSASQNGTGGSPADTPAGLDEVHGDAETSSRGAVAQDTATVERAGVSETVVATLAREHHTVELSSAALAGQQRMAYAILDRFREAGNIPDEQWAKVAATTDLVYRRHDTGDAGTGLELAATMARTDQARPCPFRPGALQSAFDAERAYLASRSALAQAPGAQLAASDYADGFTGVVTAGQRPVDKPFDPALAISKILENVTYKPQKDGSVLYLVSERPAFVDHGQQLVMAAKANEDEEAILAAVLLAKEKYGGSLEVTGSEAFQRRAIEVMLKHNIDVTLKNPQQDALRRDLAKTRGDTSEPSKSAASPGAPTTFGRPAIETQSAPVEPAAALPQVTPESLPQGPLAKDLIAVRALDWWTVQRQAIHVWAKSDAELKSDLASLGEQPSPDLVYWFDRGGKPCDPPVDAEGFTSATLLDLEGFSGDPIRITQMEVTVTDQERGKAFMQTLHALCERLSKEEPEGTELPAVAKLGDELTSIHNELWENGGNPTKWEEEIGKRIRLGTGFAARDLPTSVKELLKMDAGTKDEPKLILRGVRKLDNDEFDTTVLLFKGKGDYLQGFIKVGDEKRQVLAHMNERHPDGETGEIKPNFLKLVEAHGSGDDTQWKEVGYGNAVNRRSDDKAVFFDEVLFSVGADVVKARITKNVDDELHRKLGFQQPRQARPSNGAKSDADKGEASPKPSAPAARVKEDAAGAQKARRSPRARA